MFYKQTNPTLIIQQTRAKLRLVYLASLSLFLFSASIFSSGLADAACANTPDSTKGTDTQTINVTSAGTYTVWSRILAPDTTNNSYYLQVDGGCAVNVGDSSSIPANTWTWVNYQDGTSNSVTTVSLTAGSHQIVMTGREPGLGVDRLLFLSDPNCVPTSTGDNCTPTTDTTPPTVSMSAPANGATVSGTTTVSANASDNVGVTSVQFKLDGTALGSADTTSPYSYSWDTTKTTNGNHTLTATASDAATNTTTSTAVTVNVNNQTTDTTPPTVSLTAPANNATVSGATSISANASDNVGVTSVQFQLDGNALGSPDTVAPYTYSWDTTKVADGIHTLTAVASDAATNTTTSSSVTVTVKNTAAFSCAGNTALICEDFSTSAANFVNIGGTWNATGGQYLLTNPAQGTDSNKMLYNKALHNIPPTGDFTMTFDGSVNSTGSFADFGAAFDYQDENNYYYVDFNVTTDSTTNGLFKVVGGVQTQLAAFPNNITGNTNYQIKIVRTGSTITVSRNGTQVATASDSTFNSGSIGLGTRNDPATFDSLVVTGTSIPVDTKPPTTPTNLTATAVSSSQINLSWAASTDNVGIAGYRIYRNGGTTPIATVTTTSYGDTGLNAGTTYNYSVVAIDGANNTSGPATTSATTQAVATTATVQGVVSNSTTGNPIAGAYVHTGVHGTKTGAASAYTNSAGQYVLNGITANNAHSYYFSASSYRSKSFSLTFPPGINTYNVSLVPK
jgi:Bacterial Ig domain/Fibronectin type III domain